MAREKSAPILVSFVVRTYNEAAFIGRLLTAIGAQKGLSAEPEVVVVDSGSTDDTVAIVQRWPVKVLRIPREEFDYSEALNLGISKSCGELVVNISAHAIPAGTGWLAGMVSHFADERVAGVYCRQVPWPDADQREVRRIGREFGEAPAVYDRVPADGRVPFTNSAGCIRRSVWERHRFRLPWGEDFEWATWAVAHGFQIVYEPSVCVFHSHNLTCRQAARRLINSERSTDLELGRRRTLAFTLRQAAGHACRDIRELLALGAEEPSRLQSGWQAVARAYWFLRDFGR